MVRLLPEGHAGVPECKWCENRFTPFLCLDPEVALLVSLDHTNFATPLIILIKGSSDGCLIISLLLLCSSVHPGLGLKEPSKAHQSQDISM